VTFLINDTVKVYLIHKFKDSSQRYSIPVGIEAKEALRKQNKALITHEASIGRVSEEELNYLRSRGLTEKEAIDLIVRGFLKL
jgi:hypothetical protein